jgi:V/A-type H+-transporting ATPase subunit K
MKRGVILILFMLLTVSQVLVYAQETKTATDEIAVESSGTTVQWKYIAAAIAVGLSCIAGGIAVGQIGAAAMGAMSENPELSGKALPYAGLAEGICLWGFLVALLILILN